MKVYSPDKRGKLFFLCFGGFRSIKKAGPVITGPAAYLSRVKSVGFLLVFMLFHLAGNRGNTGIHGFFEGFALAFYVKLVAGNIQFYLGDFIGCFIGFIKAQENFAADNTIVKMGEFPNLLFNEIDELVIGCEMDGLNLDSHNVLLVFSKVRLWLSSGAGMRVMIDSL